MRGDYSRLQYEGLHELCFDCGRYGQRLASCPEKTKEQVNGANESHGVEASGSMKNDKSMDTQKEARYGKWTTLQRNRRQRATTAKGNSGIPKKI